jgi:transcriptional regulator with XRE-family HTH domain
MAKTFSDRLRQAVRESEMTRYAISVRTGIDQGTLCRFIRGERGISLDSVDRLMDCLGLEIRQRRKRKGG